MIATNGKKACVIMDGDKVVTKILVLQPVYELEGDLLLMFAVDVKKGTTLFRVDGTDITANDDYKAGDYLYFSKGTFKSKVFRFYLYTDYSADYYSEVRFLQGFDTSQWTSTSNLIGGYANKIVGLSKATLIDYTSLDTSHLTQMSKMFIGCTSLKSVDLSNMDTSNATDLWGFFLDCRSLTAVDVSGFDTSKVTDMGYMFYGCTYLTTLDVSNFDTNNVTNMYCMFCDCPSLTTLNVSGWDTSKVTEMYCMFYNCRSLTNLLFGAKWGTQTSTAANALTLDLSYLGSSKSYKLTDATYNSMLTMYDRASAGLTTMTIKFSKKHNLPDGFAEKMSALGYTITLV